MQIDIDSKSVRAMADRIAKAHEDITKPKALEILSSGFGYKNFDTLSGVLKKEPNSACAPGCGTEDPLDIPEFTPFTLVIDAFACDDDGDWPDYGEVLVTPEFIGDLARRVAVCRDAGIQAAHVNDDDGVWHDPQGELLLRGTDLVIMPRHGPRAQASFFFQGHPKHAGYNCETRAISIKDLLVCIGNAGPELPGGFLRERGVLFYDGGSGLNSLLVETYFEEEDDQRPREGDEVWWFAKDEAESGLYTVLDADRGDLVLIENGDGNSAYVVPEAIVIVFRHEVAEWVGLHYRVNFDVEPKERKIEWIGRWAQAQREAK